MNPPTAGRFFGLDVPFLEFLGVQADEFGAGGASGLGRAKISLTLRPELYNSFHVSHGGVVMTLLDVAMAMATRAAHADPATQVPAGPVMTIDLSLNFMRSAKGRLVVEGRVLQKGRSLNFCEAEAFDEAGVLVAKALGTFKLRRMNERGDGDGS